MSSSSAVTSPAATTVNGLTLNQIPCCLCGTMILPNNANQCGSCLAQQYDLREILQRNNSTGESYHIIHQCRVCRRFARTETLYEPCDIESPELLSICLKKIPALVSHKNNTSATTKLHIIDAIWVWTEPHSMRLKVRLTIRTEIEGVPIQQRVLVEYHIQWKMCDNCNREFTNRTWHAVLQLRQKRDEGGSGGDSNKSQRKGLATIEMAIRRNKEIRQKVLKIDACKNGLDFYFLTLPQAQSFAHFLSKLAPMRIKTSQKMVSEDKKNNTANMKYTLACDVVPLCRDDLIVMHKHTRGILAGRLGLVVKTASRVHIIDASPKRSATDIEHDCMELLSAEAYHKAGAEKGYTIILTAERMVRFVVLDVELCSDTTTNTANTAPNEGKNETSNNEVNNVDNANSAGASSTPDPDVPLLYEGPKSGISKYALADVLVARESDMGCNDLTYSCVTHLGHLIQPGDIVLGYDLESSSATLSASTHSMGVVDVEDIIHSNVVLPDVVLVKKIIGQDKVDDVELQREEENQNHIPGKKRISKKKLRRERKQDRKQRELNETAERMGFLEDIETNQQMYGPGEIDEDDLDVDIDFEQALANDPELAAELKTMEEQFQHYKNEMIVEEEEGEGFDEGEGEQQEQKEDENAAN